MGRGDMRKQGNGNFNSKQPSLLLSDAFVTHAQAFVERVRQYYADRPEKFDKFVRIMQQHTEGVLNGAQVSERIVTMFRSSPELVDAFKAFLPQRYGDQY